MRIEVRLFALYREQAGTDRLALELPEGARVREAQKALDRARRRKGPKPRLLVVLDLVTLEKRGRFPHLPLSLPKVALTG